jgi:hypothetical protein
VGTLQWIVALLFSQPTNGADRDVELRSSGATICTVRWRLLCNRIQMHGGWTAQAITSDV